MPKNTTENCGCVPIGIRGVIAKYCEKHLKEHLSTTTENGWEEEFDSMFDWADQIKAEELLRWKLMYGFEPKDLKTFIQQIAKEEYERGRKDERASLIALVEEMRRPDFEEHECGHTFCDHFPRTDENHRILDDILTHLRGDPRRVVCLTHTGPCTCDIGVATTSIGAPVFPRKSGIQEETECCEFSRIARREYLRGMIHGDRLPKDYTVEQLNVLYDRYLDENPVAKKEICCHKPRTEETECECGQFDRSDPPQPYDCPVHDVEETEKEGASFSGRDEERDWWEDEFDEACLTFGGKYKRDSILTSPASTRAFIKRVVAKSRPKEATTPLDQIEKGDRLARKWFDKQNPIPQSREQGGEKHDCGRKVCTCSDARLLNAHRLREQSTGGEKDV